MKSATNTTLNKARVFLLLIGVLLLFFAIVGFAALPAILQFVVSDSPVFTVVALLGFLILIWSLSTLRARYNDVRHDRQSSKGIIFIEALLMLTWSAVLVYSIISQLNDSPLVLIYTEGLITLVLLFILYGDAKELRGITSSSK